VIGAWRRLGLLLPLALVVPGGCAPIEPRYEDGPPSPPCAQASAQADWRAPWVETGEERIGFEELVRRVAASPVVLVGESHDRFDHHLAQLEIICRLARRFPDLAVGMEYFQQPFQEVLDAFVAGRIDTAEMLARSEYFERWRYDFRLYAPILELARERGIPLLALNVPREITRKVARGGLEALSAEERSRIPAELERDDPGYRARIRAVFEQHPELAGADFERFLEAQLLWDEGMAERAARYLAEHPGRRLVVLAGAGHVARDGIPARLERRAGVTVAVVQPAEAPPEARADYRLLSRRIDLPKAGMLGVYLKKGEAAGILVEDFSEGSAAQAAGIERGERIVRVEGRAVEAIGDVKVLLWNRRPGDTVLLRVADAAGAERDLEVTLR